MQHTLGVLARGPPRPPARRGSLPPRPSGTDGLGEGGEGQREAGVGEDRAGHEVAGAGAEGRGCPATPTWTAKVTGRTERLDQAERDAEGRRAQRAERHQGGVTGGGNRRPALGTWRARPRGPGRPPQVGLQTGFSRRPAGGKPTAVQEGWGLRGRGPGGRWGVSLGPPPPDTPRAWEQEGRAVSPIRPGVHRGTTPCWAPTSG